MKKFVKLLSLVLTVLMLMSVVSAATPVLAAEVTAAEQITETNIAEVQDETESSDSAEDVEIVSELTHLREEKTKYFLQSDGTYLAAQYSAPVHYLEDGKWADIDNTLVEKAVLSDGDSVREFVTKQGNNPVKFPVDFAVDKNISLSVEGYEISFAPDMEQTGIKTATGKITQESKLQSVETAQVETAGELSTFSTLAQTKDEKDTNESVKEETAVKNLSGAVAYKEVFTNVDFEYQITNTKLKESIVLKDRQDKNSFDFIMDFGGLVPLAQEDGSIILYKDETCTQETAVIMAPYMFDKAGAYSEDVTMSLTPRNGKYILTVTASEEWLNAKERVYPIVIDPTIKLDVGREGTIDCYVDASSPSSSFPYDNFLYAGHSSLGTTRTYIKFDLPKLPTETYVMINATLHMISYSVDKGSSDGYIGVYGVTEAWNNTDNRPTWTDKPTYNTTVLDYAKISGNNNTNYYFDITRTVKEWYNGGTNNGIMLKAMDETAVNRVQFMSAELRNWEAYPAIFVTFRDNKGLEGYWSYSSFGADATGAGHVNDYTGNMVYAIPILSSTGAYMPVNIIAYYNTYLAGKTYAATSITDTSKIKTKTTIGQGWRLNIQQTVIPTENYGYSDDKFKQKYPYIYTDGDGTEHYIQAVEENGKTVYKDEDGLGLTLTLNEEVDGTTHAFVMKDKSDGIMTFNNRGNLSNIYDAYGNFIHIYYFSAENAPEEKTKIHSVEDGSGHRYRFDYQDEDSNYLDKISYKGNGSSYVTLVDFTRTGETVGNKTGYNLTKVLYRDGTFISLGYSKFNLLTAANTVGNKVQFYYGKDETGAKVIGVRELPKNYDPQSDEIYPYTSFNRSKYNTTYIRTAGMDGIHNNDDSGNAADDVITTLQFDDMGRVTSQQVKYGNGTGVGAGSYGYTSLSDDNSTSAVKNKVKDTATLGKNIVNLLGSGNAENTDSWTSAKLGNGTVVSTSNVTTAEQYSGKKSLKITTTAIDSAGGSGYFYQKYQNPTIGSKYTLSAYVKTTSLANPVVLEDDVFGAFIQVKAYNSGKNLLETARSEIIKEDTSANISNGWRRLSATIDVPTGTAYLSVNLVLRNMKGNAYFDCIQLEKNAAVNSYNMLANSGFEYFTGSTPSNWSAANMSYSSSNGISTAAKLAGSNSLIITGAPGEERRAYQNIAVQPNPNDTYIVSGWAKGYAVKDTYHTVTDENPDAEESIFDIAVRVYYDCTTEGSSTVTTVTQEKPGAEFNPTISDWQFASAPFTLKYTGGESGKTYTPTKVAVMLRYHNQANYAYFDNVMLVKEPTQTYSYDNDGNMVSSSANSEQKTNAVYNDNNDLTQYTDTAGFKTNLRYNDKHSVVASVSPKGVVSVNEYTSKGAPLATNVSNGTLETTGTEFQTQPTAIIRTGQTYYADNPEKDSNNLTIETPVKESAYPKYTYGENKERSTYTYNYDTGNVSSVTDPNGNVTSYTYNNAGSQLTQVSSGNSGVGYEYYDSGRLKNILFGLGTVQETYGFTYDNWGNVKTTKVGGVTLATNTYANNNGPLTLLTYGNGDTVGYTYNNLGLVTAQKHNGSTEYTWSYSANGTVRTHVDKQNKVYYNYSYDSLGRPAYEEMRSSTDNSQVGSVSYAYSLRNKINRLTVMYGGRSFGQRYWYDTTTYNSNSSDYRKDNLPTAYVLSGSRYVTYDYDGLNRLTKRKYLINVIDGTNEFLTTTYTYRAATARNTGDETRYTTTQLATENIAGTAYNYTYGNRGNITEIKKGTAAYRSYTYDSLGQMTRENNVTANTTYKWNYDVLGNIQSVKKYAYTTDDLGSASAHTGIDYVYSNDGKNGWNRLLTSLVFIDYTTKESREETITYDAIGNPVTYRGSTLTWDGRRLKTYKKGDITYTNTYDANGLRTEKKYTQSGITYTTKYYYAGDSLAYQVLTETDSNNNTTIKNELYFFYDSYGNLTLIKRYINGSLTDFPVLTNSQGDVVAIYNTSGTKLYSYEYDAWGNTNVIKEDTNCTDDIGTLNPIRYRGYYYDSDLKLYYLQSRYYDAEIGRFISVDDVDLLGANGDFASLNLFAYCGNNPVSREDPNGGFWVTAGVMAVGGLIGAAISAVSSAITQKVFNDEINWKSVGVAALSGLVSGAVAASPLGLVGQQVLGGVIGGASYVADCYVNDKALRLDEGILAVGMGAISGRIGGTGANNKFVLSNVAKSTKQTIARETRRANQQYAQKAIAATISSRNNIFATTAYESIFKYSVGVGTANGLTGAYGNIEIFPNVPEWKPW